jgi:hypothetical protein
MDTEQPAKTPEKKEALDDNALKFIIDEINPVTIASGEITSYEMTTDWIHTGVDDEEKLVLKQYDDGSVKRLRIRKERDSEGGRKSVKTPLSENEYLSLLVHSKITSTKKRTDFIYQQNGTQFVMTYDEFTGSALRILEVDAENPTLRQKFKTALLPAELKSVTGDLRYYGYRVTDML